MAGERKMSEENVKRIICDECFSTVTEEDKEYSRWKSFSIRGQTYDLCEPCWEKKQTVKGKWVKPRRQSGSN